MLEVAAAAGNVGKKGLGAMLRNRLFRLSLASLAGAGMALSLSGCFGGPAEAPSTTGISESGVPSSTAPATDTPATTTPSPSATPTPTPTPPPSETAPAASPSTMTSALTIFYVALNDQGKSGPMIGCGDSIVATETGPVVYASQVEAAMSDLLNDKDSQHGQSGLMNALAGSDLTYVSSSVAGDTVTVELSGVISSGGVCDDPRIIAQLTYTAMVAAETGEAKVLVNGIDINKYLSQK